MPVVSVSSVVPGPPCFTFTVVELRLLSDVLVVGTKNLSDKELLALVRLRAGDPADPYLIERGRNLIKQEYAKKGIHDTEIEVDQDLLKESGIPPLRSADPSLTPEMAGTY